MSDSFASDGWPVLAAMKRIVDGPARSALDRYLKISHLPGNEVETRIQLQTAWSAVLFKVIYDGLFIITGYLPGDREPRLVENGLLQTSKVNPHENALVTSIGVFVGVMIRQVRQHVPKDQHQQPRTGPRPLVRRRVEMAMREQLDTGRITESELSALNVKQLPGLFGGGVTTCVEARKAVLAIPKNSEKTPKNEK